MPRFRTCHRLNGTYFRVLILVGIPFTVWGGRQFAAQEQQQKQIPPRVRINSDLVTQSVTVRDQAGNLVGGLGREQFHLFDDGVEQRIDVFEEESLPLALVILIDNDLNGKEGEQMARSLRALLGAISLQDRAMVCRFDLLFYPGDGFTSDQDKLMTAVKGAQSELKPTPKYVPEPLVCGNSTTGPPCIAAPTYAGSRPSKALDDAIFSAAELLQNEGVDHRKIILLISDGANEPKLNKHDLDSVKTRILYENISVFSLATSNKSPKSETSRLEEYSRISGGDVYLASKVQAIEESYSRITEQARHEYTIAYVPRGNNAASNYHRIELHVDGGGLKVQTREGYYKNLPEQSHE